MRTWVLALPGLMACDPNAIDAVGSPGGLWRPGAGCVTEEAGKSSCPLESQWAFEREVDAAAFSITTPGTLSNRRVTCTRSFCGTGSLAAHAVYRWDPDVSPSPRMGSMVHKLPQPVDLLGKILTFRVFVKQLRPAISRDGFATPINAQIAVVHNRRYRIVWDGPLLSGTSWNALGDVLNLQNQHFADLPPSTTSLPVTEVSVHVYLATSIRNGDQFEGEVFIDEIGWR